MFIICQIKTGGDSDVIDMTVEVAFKDSELRGCWGVVLKEEGRVVRSPIYPFISSYYSIDALNDFLEIYSEDLLKFYRTTNGLDFGKFLYGFETEVKEDFRNHWFKKGVIIY